jgi:hypothetical protein
VSPAVITQFHFEICQVANNRDVENMFRLGGRAHAEHRVSGEEDERVETAEGE